MYKSDLTSVLLIVSASFLGSSNPKSCFSAALVKCLFIYLFMNKKVIQRFSSIMIKQNDCYGCYNTSNRKKLFIPTCTSSEWGFSSYGSCNYDTNYPMLNAFHMTDYNYSQKAVFNILTIHSDII